MPLQFKAYRIVPLLAVMAVASPAGAAPSWSSQPAWASNADNADSGARETPRKSSSGSSYSRDTRYNVAPFTPGSHNLALDVGQVFLMGDLASAYADSIGSQLHYTYGVSDMFGFDASLGYSGHSDGEYSQTTLLSGLRTNLAWYDKVVPYLVVGLGFYKPSYEVIQASGMTTSLSPVLFGLHMGPGVDLELTKQLFFGASLTFHDMFGTKKMTSQGPKDLGGTYTSFFLRAGVTF